MNKAMLAVMAVSFAAFLSVPAAAETFTTSDGVLSIELPNDNWKEVEDSSTWVTLSDGSNVLTINHYSNGEKLPEITVADSHYVDVYQAAYSTQNEVFIITGSLVDKEDVGDISSMIMSAKVLKYDTKTAVPKEDDPQVSEFSIAPVDKTMYVTADGLNIRSGCSTDDQILGSFGNGEAVHVTGIVQRNGEDYGWCQVSFASGTGYVSEHFLSDSAPTPSSDPTPAPAPPYSGNVITVYTEEGDVMTLYEGMDGLWRDKSGTAYTRISDTDFQVYEGTKRVFTYDPTYDPGTPTGVVTAYGEDGSAVTLYESTDGYWYDASGTAYVQHSASDFQVLNGNKHLTVR